MSSAYTVTCQICETSMAALPARLDLRPADWRPSHERLAKIFAEVFYCGSCGRVAIRPGASTELVRLQSSAA